MMLLAAVTVRAQDTTPTTPETTDPQTGQSTQSASPIKIAGNVYGGGKAGAMTGSTKVTVYAGDLNEVYGGAQMANVGGSTFVNIDGAHASDNIIINKVYGGNDVAGTIGHATTLPTELEEVETVEGTGSTTANGKSDIDNTWSAFVRTSTTQENGKDKYRVIIGSLFGGGNGDYDYASGPYANMTKPLLGKAYLELKGGCIAHVYGGGNNATVTGNTTLCINNQGSVLADLLTDDEKTPANFLKLANRLGLSTSQSDESILTYHFARVFGGNNKAEMAIMPKWNLKKGNIRDLYSGGNEGKMTSPTGIMLEIPVNSDIMAYNVYGGCRKANVEPLSNGTLVDHVSNLSGYYFPKDFAARVIIRGGDIYNVYGGNDISGKVYFGNAVGIYTSIKGNVYGGGNGSYAYTDNADLKDAEDYRDYYYNPDNVLQEAGVTVTDNTLKSATALNYFRPNAEQVSICVAGRVEGEGASQVITPTIIHGSVFCGGNSATLKQINITKPLVELKIGYYAIMDKVFLGCNGENMIDEDVLKLYAGNVSVGQSSYPFSQMDLTESATFKKYMEGCAMDIIPSVVFENTINGDRHTYIDYTSSVGSFYCGGNVGSMTGAGTTTIDFDHKIIVYDKLVGGCNNAIVKATDNNALYEGGLIGLNNDPTGNKLVLNLSGLKIEPKRWAVQRDADYKPVLTNGQPTYLFTDGTNYNLTEPAPNRHHYLEWNTVDSRTYNTGTKKYTEVPAVEPNSSTVFNTADLYRRLYGGNIYGGCCESGIVNGNVVINLNATIVERSLLFDSVKVDKVFGEEDILYGETQTQEPTYTIEERRTGVILGRQGMDVFGSALNVFGGGKGKKTEIWGSTTVNLNQGYTFQIFGGSEEGVIGKPIVDGNDAVITTDNSDGIIDTNGTYHFNGRTYTNNPAYSCYVNLRGNRAGVSKKADQSEEMAECEFMYGGGFFGPILGNTVVNLGKGRVFNSFGGSCNADILGHAELYMGRQVKAANMNRLALLAQNSLLSKDTCYVDGFPWVRDMVYGGNDLGGRILSEVSFKDRVRKTTDPYGLNVLGMVHKYNASTNTDPDVLTASAYVEYLEGRSDAIFGGCYGTYDYSDPKFERYTYTQGETVPTGKDLGDSKLDTNGNPLFYKPRINNAFVNFRPTYYNINNVVKRVYGAGQGQSREKERDLLQNRSYVLIDIPQIATTSESSGSSDSSESSESSESENFNKYTAMEVFGAGAWAGVGMNVPAKKKTTPDGTSVEENPDNASAIIDLVRGDIGAVYGASYEEGVTRRTVVNVPAAPAGSPTGTKGSTIKVGSIFGGGFGTSRYLPCDAYESHVEYHSGDACLIYNENDNNPFKALQKGAIYGGNNSKRRTLYAKVNIDVPLWQSHIKYGMTKGTIYGSGCGAETWSEYTEVNLNPGADVYEVYGGGQDSKVLNSETIYKYITDYKPDDWGDDENNPTVFTDADWEAAWKLGGGLDPASNVPYWQNEATNLSNPLVRVAEVDDRDFSDLTPADLALVQGRYCANVIINEGATVRNYAYGGGYGPEAYVAGSTYVALLGGEVWKDIYASGTSGSVEDYHRVGYYDQSNPSGFMCSANVYIKGGTVRNVYGGGWRGNVGKHDGLISDVANNTNDILGEAHVVIGDLDGTSHTNGIPSITRNVYGGGEGGVIFGDAYVTINKGYIGYRYDGSLNDDQATKDFDERYVAELDDAKAGDNQLDKGGNVFGGGYVANSYVDKSHVTMWGGIVRGGLYGGGEIGPIGRGTVKEDAPAPTGTITSTDTRNKAKIYKGGSTEVYLYDGHVLRDVFGGGRGYDNWGGEGWMTDDEKLTMDRSSKGYVFGQTNVHIYGGEIGTEAGVLQGYGNVFGGGNEGFVYSATGKKVGSDKSDQHLTNGKPTDGGGFYYEGGSTSNPLTRDCYVEVAPKCKVTASGGISGFTAVEGKVKASYSKDEYVPVEALNQLKNRNDATAAAQWAKLDTRGIIIHNALFAGGNITEGSDKLFANTITVYGNAAASLRDVYNIDLITLGTEDMGGLYGDGNLTLVDGFRELHIDNYGTDYYSLDETLDTAAYFRLAERQRDYYKLKYVTASSHTYDYYESKTLHTYVVKDEDNNVVSETPYKKGQKITESEYLAFPSVIEGGEEKGERKNWVKGRKAYQDDDQIEESEYILMDAGEQAAWMLYGVTSIYAGRPMNTIQRADMCGVFGSRMVLKGAQDRVPEAVDYTSYTINRVDEVSLNKNISQANDTGDDAVHGNYFGIYNVVNYLGNLTSDVFFDDVRKTDSKLDANKATFDYPAAVYYTQEECDTYNAEHGLVEGQTGYRTTSDIKTPGTPRAYGSATYYQWKAAKPQAKNRNNGTSHNMVALASGVYLEIKREEGEATGTDDWGYITGIVELDLINVMQGMGGGYVYARNEHGVKTWHSEYGKVTILDENLPARTYRRFEYTKPGSSKQVIQTSGNFVHNTKQIVDDCYPNSGMYNPDKVAYEDSPAHYWFIRGSIYVYDQYISAFTGSANAYAEKVEMPLTIAAAANGRMTLREVQPNYYAYYDKNGNKLGDKSPGVNADEQLIINNVTYKLNDPVSYWEYRLMSDADRSRFEKETYVVIEDCKVGSVDYPKGTVLTLSEYQSLKGTGSGPAVTYTEGDEVKNDGNFEYFFRSSNNISHDTGYVLTYDVNNPGVWNNYYTKTEAPAQENKLSTALYDIRKDKQGNTISKSDYTEGPTFSPKSGNSVYGQEEIMAGNIVYGTTYTNYTTNVSSKLTSSNTYKAVANGTTLKKGNTYYTSSTGADEFTALGTEVANGTNYYIGQATVTEKAYVVTKEYSVKENGIEVQHLNPGTPVYKSKYTDSQWTTMTSGTSPAVEEAKVCTKLIEFSGTDYVYAGQLLTAAEVTAIKNKLKAKNSWTDAQVEEYLQAYIDDAYYCTKNGLYGGSYFEANKAYRAIDTWCSISDADRANFVYNYDALDLLVDPTYCGRLEDTFNLDEHYGFKPQYDGYAPETTEEEIAAATSADAREALAQYTGSTPLYDATTKTGLYSATQPIDYQAECTTAVSYTDENGASKSYATTDPWLSREKYEDIPNEKHHYSPISVTAPGDYYVVKKAFMKGDIPYTTGQVIDGETYNSMTPQQRTNIDVVTFTEDHTQKKLENGVPVMKDGEYVYESINYFYCREAYKVNEKGEGEPVKAVVANANGRNSEGTTVAISVGDEVTSGNEVPAGFIIAQGASDTEQYSYNSLPNFQSGNFLIHGTSPTEVSTLYVSSESDINDLSKEKIITVIYLYEYEESDESGLNVVPVSERHVVNIHINFKSGVPEIGEIAPPATVLPGTTLGLNIPTVSQGAYRVTESGWEIFENSSDATTHYNGQTYTNNETPVWWYQNNYWIAYYAKTRLGKTYSNSVPVSVANYHDLAKVMGDKQHHYYIDHKDVDRKPKIYINDYSKDATPQNGLDLFKNLIDLSHVQLTYTTNSEGNQVPVPISGGTLDGHVPLERTSTTETLKPMRGGKYLEFFLNADQDHGKSAWTSIANNSNECFSGILHGDGHTISGLSSSLFNHLCGDVYNLGVTGTFSGAGVAETGEGYVENCWINTTGTPDGSVYAVFGNPSAAEGTKQIVNSYYQATKNYLTTSSSHGLAKPMSDEAFYNGTVAYDLNGFYLWKRYCDQTVSAGTDDQKYQYYTVGSDNQLTLQSEKYYDADASLCSSGYRGQKYVEDRFADGDFIYVGDGFGTIPGSANKRLYTDPVTKKEIGYFPIWPDDYLFFGQALNYSHMDGLNGRDLRTHQDLPSVIKKSDDRVLTTDDGNRVYRAPAYFRSKKMGVAHFNPYAVFAAEEKLTTAQITDHVTARKAYPNMTAIDFTGTNESGYQKGAISTGVYADITGGAFFPPLLDDGGVEEFYNADLTRNLLAYTMTGTTAANKTNGVVSAYLHDEAYVETDSEYHTVDVWDRYSDNVRGHWVQKQSDNSFLAKNDHMLVDKQDFNAPIEYTFATDQRMWYQRMPGNYVEPVWSNDATPVRSTKGWEGVSLPFKAEIVTTDVKGEITHFYEDSWESKNGTRSKIGHEYWLREFISGGSTSGDIYKANFKYPNANSTDGEKENTNTFLWDYYYSYNNYKDQNGDDYQEDDSNHDYYKSSRTHANYPRLAAVMPYIIGFPGERYYEFDLSGNFEALTAKSTRPVKLKAQTITFASKPGATTIHVSDDEIEAMKANTTHDNYTFLPSYMNETLKSVAVNDNTKPRSYALNADGNAYIAVTRAADADEGTGNVSVLAFRPYFTSVAGTRPARNYTRSIIFSNEDSQLKGVEERGDPKDEAAGALNIYAKKHKIVVESSLAYTTDVRIVNLAGITINSFTIEPGETVETRINNAGVYIVEPTEARYIKKLTVR